MEAGLLHGTALKDRDRPRIARDNALVNAVANLMARHCQAGASAHCEPAGPGPAVIL